MVADQNKYFISPDQNLPEITPKVIVIVIFLTVFLAASNIYLGLKVGLTITGSIPAAVIAMGILRFFKQHNVLENNIAQTAVSAGSIIISGVIFTIPAALIMGAWTHIEYWPTVGITLLGGILGVLFSIPLRRALLDDPSLRFPEGVAVGEVLKHSAGEKLGLGTLLTGGVLGAVVSTAQIGLKVIAGGISYWTQIGPSLYGLGLGFSPALIGAGFIVGLSVSMSMLLGVILGWIIGVPLISAHHGIPVDLMGHPSSEIAYFYWSHYIRYIGIGTIMVGSIWAIICLINPMIAGIRSSLAALKQRAKNNIILRTEKDISIKKVLISSLIVIFCIFGMINLFAKQWVTGLAPAQYLILSLISAALIYGLGFIVSAICGYFAGLVGSSISPVSSMILISTITISLILLGLSFLWHLPAAQLASLAVLGLLINAVIAAVAAVSNDVMQDLKAGQIIGATPWKQQAMLFLGVAISAFVVPLVIELLYQAYGLGGIFPRPGMDAGEMLLAPQASLVAAVTQGVFALSLPWELIGFGIIIAFLVVLLDRLWLRHHGLRLPILGVGIGIYLPFESTIPLILGGIAAGCVTHFVKKHLPKQAEAAAHKQADIHQRGLLAGCGLVAGSALAGVALAVPFAIAGSSNILSVVGPGFKSYANGLGLMTAAGLVYWIYRVSTKQVS